MNQQAVRQKMELFLQHLREEQELRDELGALEFQGVTEPELKKAHERQKVLLRELDSLRQEKMLPLLTEVAEFVAAKKVEMGLSKPAGGQAPPKPAMKGSPGGRK